MQLHPVKAGLPRIFRSILIVVKQAGNLADFKRPCLHIIPLAGIGADAARRGRRRSRDGFLAIQEIGMDDAAHMPELTDDPATGLMNALDNGLPCFGLRVIPDTRRKRRAQALLADPGRFGDDQAGTGALGIIFAHDRRRDMFHGRTAAGEGSHEHAVRSLNGANGDRIK